MRLWQNPCTDPYLNMATEEFLLQTETQPCIMLWQNAPAVIIGKNQDAMAEVDFAFTKAHDICVVRRLTGGGAVFHDIGNVNYTFVVPDGSAPDFAAFTTPVLEALSALGIRAERSGRNDLVLCDSGKKFSGTAECVFPRKTENGTQKMLLHHGTLLFSADMRSLSGALTPDRAKLEAKGVKSVKSRVCNLIDVMPPEHFGMKTADFKAYLEGYFIEKGAIPASFSKEDRQKIALLAKEKYQTDAWTIGRFAADAPPFSRRFAFGTVRVSLAVTENRIDKVHFSGDFFGNGELSPLEASLCGVPLELDALLSALSDISHTISGATPKEIAVLLLDAAKETK